jgi:hypothetical protein
LDPRAPVNEPVDVCRDRACDCGEACGESTAEKVARPEADSTDVTGAAVEGCMKRAESEGTVRALLPPAWLGWDNRDEEPCWTSAGRSRLESSAWSESLPEWLERGELEVSMLDRKGDGP